MTSNAHPVRSALIQNTPLQCPAACFPGIEKFHSCSGRHRIFSAGCSSTPYLQSYRYELQEDSATWAKSDGASEFVPTEELKGLRKDAAFASGQDEDFEANC